MYSNFLNINESKNFKQMKTIYLTVVILLLSVVSVVAQNDTIKPANNLLGELTEQSNEEFQLLPSKMIFTQRLLWGNKGLMRGFSRFELTPEKRQKELNVRRKMLATHQIMGFVTLGSMISQMAVGAGLYNGNNNLKEAHEALGVLTNLTYATTASLALFAPPKMLDERKGYSSIKVHRILAIIHITGMITTNVLASMLEEKPELKPYHMAAAITTFASFATAVVIIKF